MIELIYENDDWLPFFEKALDEVGVPYRLNFIENLQLDMNQPPDNILYLNRVSPSSHTRGHFQSIINCEQYLEYLDAYNRRVINGAATLTFEHSKVDQYRLLKRLGMSYPRTVFSSQPKELARMAAHLTFPVLTKHNCSGKGLGIERFDSVAQLNEQLLADETDDRLSSGDRSTKYDLITAAGSPDGIYLVQEYIEPRGNRITRVEIIDGQLVYAFHARCDQGFELCPADACLVGSGDGKSSAPDADAALFEFIPDFEHPLVSKYCDLCQQAGYDMAGIEFVESMSGSLYTYDINGTTNYSPDVERQSDNKARIAFQKLVRRLLNSEVN